MKNQKKYDWIIGIAVWLGLALCGVEYLAGMRGLELRTAAQVGKGIYLWFLMPCIVLYGLNRLMKGDGEEESRTRRRIRRVATVLAALVILAVSFCRGTVYVFTREMVTETTMEDGYIRGAWSDFLSETTYEYYEPVAVFFRRPFSGWTEDELLRKVRERFTEEAEYVESQEDGRCVFRVRDPLAEGEYIYFHVNNSYQMSSNYKFQVLLSEACHFWANRERLATLSETGNVTLESGRDTGSENWKKFWEEPNRIYITCYGTEEDVKTCAADVTDWFDFVKQTGQLSLEDPEVCSLLGNIMIGNSGNYFSLNLAVLSDVMGDDPWESRYQLVLEKISDGFERLQESAAESESSQSGEDENVISEEEYNRQFMERYSGEYEKECLVGDGSIRYRMVVLDAALGSRYYGLLKSTDSGQTWEMWSSSPFDSLGMGVDFTFLTEDFGFATLMHNGGDSADLYVTEDGGKSYQAAVMQEYTVTLDDGYTYAPYDYPEMPYEEDDTLYVLCGQGADGDYDGGDAAGMALYQSTDGGHTWTFVKIQKLS